jgi:hypothetical protein
MPMGVPLIERAFEASIEHVRLKRVSLILLDIDAADPLIELRGEGRRPLRRDLRRRQALRIGRLPRGSPEISERFHSVLKGWLIEASVLLIRGNSWCSSVAGCQGAPPSAAPTQCPKVESHCPKAADAGEPCCCRDPKMVKIPP